MSVPSAVDSPREATLDIAGMTCASCVARVEKKLQAVDGVDASVNLATESARVSYPAELDLSRLVAAVNAAGYDATIRAAEPDGASVDAENSADVSDSGLARRLVVSAALAVPVVVTGMVPALQFPGWQWVSLALTTPIVLWGGWPFHRATLRNLRHGTATMDTLITMGTFAAYLWSVWALFFGTAGRIPLHHEVALFGRTDDATSLVYFEVAAAVTVFLLLGRLIEYRSKRRAGSALRALMTGAATEAELLDGRRIPVSELAVGDRFRTRPGQTIATDAEVIDGTAAVDQSMLTGEAIPVDMSPGDIVTGGTVVVDGMLTLRATSIGESTRLARIARIVEDAQTRKGRVQRLADRISSVFVPIVIALAVVTLVLWLLLDGSVAAAFTAAVAVLIIACPCALGLATPIAVLVGTSQAATQGILVTGPEALERAERLDAVVLDKTGTVTAGKMSLAAVVTEPDTTRTQALALAAALENASEHPVARAIAGAAPATHSVSDFRAHAGLGVSGRVDGRLVYAGQARYLAELGADVPAELGDAVQQVTPAGSVVWVAWADGDEPLRVRAGLVVTDDVRVDAPDTVAALADMGADVILLTGDNENAAKTVADKVGISTVIAGVSPEGKRDAIAALQSSGKTVAMVGDGINDSAALATADLGIAMGGGTDAAQGASDITLVRSDLAGVVTAVRLSRRTMRVIRQNLFWAFAYNVAALPLAAFGLLNPMIAGAAMAFSSVFVVLNSLRLRRAL